MKNINIRSQLYIIIITIIVTSCSKTLDNFEFKDEEDLLVINSLFEPDSLIKIEVSQTIGALEQEIVYYINNATVTVTDNEGNQTVLNEFDEGEYYKTGFVAQNNKSYTVQVKAPGFNDVDATVKLLEQIEVISIDTITRKMNNEWGYSQPFFNVSIKIKNTTDKTDYYIVYIENPIWYTDYTYHEDNTETIDTIFINELYYLQSDDPKVSLGLDYSYINNYEGFLEEEEKYGQKFVFSDVLIGNEDPVFRIKIYADQINYSYGINSENDSLNDFNIVIHKISDDYYKHLIGMSLYSDDPFESFFMEKISTLSNVNNGVGMIASQSTYRQKFFVRNQNFQSDQLK